MIRTTKRKLSIIFSAVVICFSLLVLAAGFYLHHRSIVKVITDRMLNSEKNEFILLFFYSDIDSFSSLNEEEIYQVFDTGGHLVVSTPSGETFRREVDQEVFAAAVAGRDSVLMVDTDEGELYSLLYFPLNEQYVGRIAMDLRLLRKYDKTFLLLVLFALPGFFLISFVIGRSLVNFAMKPIAGAFRFQENFSSNVAHELLTPLTTLKGNLELSLRKERDPAGYREFIEEALGETDHIICVLRDLHLLASAKFKPMELQHAKTDLVDLCRQRLHAHQAMFSAIGITLRDELPDDTSAMCLCDSHLISRVFDNLFDNMAKYTIGGGPCVVGFKVHRRKAIFWFTNHSLPIAKKELKQLCEPFFRAANGRNSTARGKGLGLNLVSYIIRSHRGNMRISQQEDNFRVEIQFPLAV